MSKIEDYFIHFDGRTEFHREVLCEEVKFIKKYNTRYLLRLLTQQSTFPLQEMYRPMVDQIELNKPYLMVRARGTNAILCLFELPEDN